jgi:hypothetical protein
MFWQILFSYTFLIYIPVLFPPSWLLFLLFSFFFFFFDGTGVWTQGPMLARQVPTTWATSPAPTFLLLLINLLIINFFKDFCLLIFLFTLTYFIVIFFILALLIFLPSIDIYVLFLYSSFVFYWCKHLKLRIFLWALS